MKKFSKSTSLDEYNGDVPGAHKKNRKYEICYLKIKYRSYVTSAWSMVIFKGLILGPVYGGPFIVVVVLFSTVGLVKIFIINYFLFQSKGEKSNDQYWTSYEGSSINRPLLLCLVVKLVIFFYY